MILMPDVTSHKLLHWSNVDRNGFRDTFTFFHWCRYITLGNCNRNFFITSKLDMKTQHFNISAVFRCFYQSKFGVNTWFPAGPSWRLAVRLAEILWRPVGERGLIHDAWPCPCLAVVTPTEHISVLNICNCIKTMLRHIRPFFWLLSIFCLLNYLVFWCCVEIPTFILPRL